MEHREKSSYLTTISKFFETKDSLEIHFTNPLDPSKFLKGIDITPKGGKYLVKKVKDQELVYGLMIPKSPSDEVFNNVLENLEKEGICSKTLPERIIDAEFEEIQPQLLSEKEISAAEEIAEMAEKVKKGIDDVLKKNKAKTDEYERKLKEADEKEAELLKRTEKLKEEQERLNKERNDFEQKLADAVSREAKLHQNVLEKDEILKNSIHVPKPKNTQEEVEAQRKFQEALDSINPADEQIVRMMLGRNEPVVVKENQVFVLQKERYEVNCDIIIEPGGAITIEPGTNLFFDENGGIVCRGIIKAMGKEDDPIAFQSIEEGKNWKNIHLEGDEDKLLQNCIVMGGGGRTYKTSKENKTAVLDPTNKGLKRGGGIACLNGCENTNIFSVVVGNNKVDGSGGGIWNCYASPGMKNVHCLENEAMTGAGIHIEGGDPNLFNVECRKNIAKGNGGGMMIHEGSPHIADSVFEENTAGNGGGLYIYSNSNTVPHLNQIKVANNIASQNGGGTYIELNYNSQTGESHPPSIKNSDVEGNKAKSGGAFYVFQNISRWSYNYFRNHQAAHPDFKELTILDTVGTGNTPDNVKEVFRSEK